MFLQGTLYNTAAFLNQSLEKQQHCLPLKANWIKDVNQVSQYLDRLLSDGWICVCESVNYVRKDLGIDCCII